MGKKVYLPRPKDYAEGTVTLEQKELDEFYQGVVDTLLDSVADYSLPREGLTEENIEDDSLDYIRDRCVEFYNKHAAYLRGRCIDSRHRRFFVAGHHHVLASYGGSKYWSSDWSTNAGDYLWQMSRKFNYEFDWDEDNELLVFI